MKPWRVPFPKFGKGPGLERVARVAARLGVDLAGFGQTGAVIVGSNGKGSTAAMSAALLWQSARGVGLFTSPHLFALNERFNIDGENIDDDELARHWGRVEQAAREAGEHQNLGAFEFLFLTAADWFKARGCARTVWEAGIGGRLDPVRLIQARRLALTSLDLEHTDLLGDTIEEIARDKLDAAPDGAHVYLGISCSPQRAAIEAHAAARGLMIEFAAPSASCTPLFGLPLPGEHQRENAALALALARDVTESEIRDDVAAGALAGVRWPGRLEALSAEPLVVIDVGHTPDAVRRALAGFAALREERPGVLVCGVSADKSAAEIVAILAPAFGTIICAAARHKGAPPAEIAAQALRANPGAEIIIADSVAEARRLALARGGAVYVAGGLFLAGEYRALHFGHDPACLSYL